METWGYNLTRSKLWEEASVAFRKRHQKMEEILGERTRKREGWWREENVVPGVRSTGQWDCLCTTPVKLPSAGTSAVNQGVAGARARPTARRTLQLEHLRDSFTTEQQVEGNSTAGAGALSANTGPCPRHRGSIYAARTFEDSHLWEKRRSQNWLRPTHRSLIEWGLKIDMNLSDGK